MSDLSPQHLHVEAHEHLRAGRLDEARTLFQQYLQRFPRDGHTLASLGEIALAKGELVEAERRLVEALQADPGLVSAANNLAILYRHTNRPENARDLLRQVLARKPDFAKAHYNLGNVLSQLHDDAGAVEAFVTALRLQPHYPKALAGLAGACHLTCRLDVYLEYARKAAPLDPTPKALSTLLFYAMFSPDWTAEQVAERAEAWDARFAAPLRGGMADKETGRQGGKESTGDSLPLSNKRDPERPLRVGYVGPMFYAHAIGLLIEPLMTGHNRDRFRIYCYSDTVKPDAVTERIRAGVDVFRETAKLSEEQLAELIRGDEIDILIDPNLHMEDSRLRVFARRVAPVQINYLAYPFTSGLRTMDYRVTDALLEPPGQPVLGPEKSIRLRTSFWLFRPNAAAPAPAETVPARAKGHVTFASFNFSQKLNRVVAATWARILNRTPGSRLLLLADVPMTQATHIARLFLSAGLDPRRLDLVGPLVHHVHLERYRHADLCLDPIPYGGHTTALDALWMGVPVLTLAGRAPYHRGAASILPRVGLEELVTKNLQEYEEKAVALAHNLDELDRLRLGLRERMQASVLCDERGFVADFERGLRLAWRRYCEGLGPEEIDLS